MTLSKPRERVAGSGSWENLFQRLYESVAWHFKRGSHVENGLKNLVSFEKDFQF